MAFRSQVWFVALVLLSLVAGGCRTHGPVAKTPRAGTTRAAKAEAESPKDAEKRVEAHTHYAMGVLHELNKEPDAAIEEFTKSLELDLGNESLVVEFSNKLIQLKRYTKAEEVLARATARPNASAILFARLGATYSSLGKREQAITANNTALKKDPRLLIAYQNLLQLYLQGQQYDDALKVLERAAAVRDPDGRFLLDMAELYQRFARTGSEREKLGNQRAAELLDRAAELAAKDPVTQKHIADAYARRGDVPKAIKLYLKLLDQSDDPLSVRQRLITLYLNVNDRAGVAQQLEAIARDYPTVQAFLSLGNLASLQTNYTAASEFFNKALQLDPKSTPALLSLGNLASLQTNYTAAAEFFNKALQLDPKSIPTLLALGALAQEQTNHTAAIKYFNQALQLDSNSDELYFKLAGAQINADQPRDGLATLDKVRAKFSRTFLTELYSAMAFSKMKDFTNAVSRYTDAEKIAQVSDTNRLNHVFYFQFGAACERAQQFAEAEKHFKRALQLDADFAEALNYLGYMWADRTEHLQEAREMIEKAVKLEPDNAAFIDSLGWVLFRLNQPEEALPHIQRAIELSREPDATLYDHLGDIYATLNQPDKAREAWRKSLKIEPNEAIRKKLEPARPAKATPR